MLHGKNVNDSISVIPLLTNFFSFIFFMIYNKIIQTRESLLKGSVFIFLECISKSTKMNKHT